MIARLCSCLLWAAATPMLAAQSVAEPPDPALRARFGFVGPIAHKVGEGINLLQVANLDDDPAAEIIVQHARRGRLELLDLTEQQLNSSVEATPAELSGLQVADANGDGQLDLLMLHARGRLTVRLRGPKAQTLPELDIGLPAALGGLRCGDLDGDGRADAVAVTRDGLRVVTKIAEGGLVSEPATVGDARMLSFSLTDVDADGKLDVVLANNAERGALRVKLGQGDGKLGPWILLDGAKITGAFPATGVGGATLAVIEGAHRRIVEYALRHGQTAARPAVTMVPLPPRTQPGPTPFAHGDADGDGDLDLVIADPERASLTWLLEDQGRFVTRHTPALAGINALAFGDLDGDQRNDLLLVSPEEEALAWKSGALPLDAVPARLPVAEIPVAGAIHGGAVWLLAPNKNRQAALYRIAFQAGEAAHPEKLLDVGRLAADPMRLLVTDLHGGPEPEVAFVIPGSGLQILLRNAEGALIPPDPNLGPGFTRKLDDGALAVVRVGDRDALLVVRDRFARLFRPSSATEPEILRQDNGPAGSEGLSLAALAPDGAQLFLDRTGAKLYRIDAAKTSQSIDVPPVEAHHLLAHGHDALVVGRQGVLRAPFVANVALAAVRTLEPPTDKTNWWNGVAADLDGDGQRELALLDEDCHGVHVLVATAAGLARALSFPVFEHAERSDNLYEPREIAAGDVNGDGRCDLVLLANDRVLVYLQEP